MNYLNDEKGNKSSLRLNLFLTLIASIWVVLYQVHTQTVDHGLIAMLLGVVFGSKNIDTHLRNKPQQTEKQANN
mgnify:CR=1 FL=1